VTGIGQAFVGWATAATLLAVAAGLLLRTGRRRAAINKALHELRRPLQALALAGGAPEGSGVVESSTRLAAAALERLDREVNGGEPGSPAERTERVRCEAALRSAVGRWRARVAMAGGSLELHWRAGEAVVIGERAALEQAVDNLIVNAIEHGGPEILVEGRRRGLSLVISVVDSGRRQAGDVGQASAIGHDGSRGSIAAVARITGRRRHGHGLAVVRRIAAGHRGRFVLRRAGAGWRAVLELPLAADGPHRPDAAA
jgi:light-regulated signal transduction histidine kinase (bacteriophytochrome)